MQHNILNRFIVGNFCQKSSLVLKFPKNIDLIIILLLCGSMLLPVIPIASIKLRISDFVSLLIIPMLVLSHSKTKKSKFLFHFAILFCTLIFSTLFGYLFLDVPVSIRDFNELLRMLIPLLIYWIAFNTNICNLKNTIHLFFFISSPLIAMFSLIQFFFPHSIPVFLLSLYGGGAHVNKILTRSTPRIFATGSDPNVGCVILILFFFYHISRFLFQKKFYNFCFALVFLILIGFTASRTGIISLFFTFIVFSFFSKNVKLYIKFFILILLSIFFWFVWESFNYVRDGFLLFVAGENVSWISRLDKFEEALTLFKLSPIFGWGPAKAIHNIVVDGDYFLIIRRYGIVGFFCLISFLLKSTFFAFTRFEKNIFQENKDILLTFLLYSISIFIIMITNSFFSGYQLSIIYMVLLGFICRFEKEYIQQSNNHKKLSRCKCDCQHTIISTQ